MYQHTSILCFGCGCNKNKGAAAGPRTSRQTVYQVVKDGGVVSEFGTLSEARTEAIATSGQVRVSSKTVTT